MRILERLGLRRPRTLEQAGSNEDPRLTTPGSTTTALVAATATDRTSPAYCVIDTETTGLSPQRDRVLELAIIRCDTAGEVIDEWVCRFNPQGPVGATHIHGITAADVADSPLFNQVAPQIAGHLAGMAVVAHNARFDLAFLRAEFDRAGWDLPHLPALCTLELSRHFLPHLDRRRLPDCCHAAGTPLEHAHSALGDARATAGLLAYYLNPHLGIAPLGEHLTPPDQAANLTWPTRPARHPSPPPPSEPRHRPRHAATPRTAAPRLTTLLEDFPLTDALDEGAPDGSLAYLELLAEALEDGRITDEEATALADLATHYDLSPDDVQAAGRGFVLALAHRALDDGRVTHAERTELYDVAAILELDRTIVLDTLERAEAARHHRLSQGLRPLPDTWSLGEPLRVGDKIAFTGCEDHDRDNLERRAESLGVRVVGTVSRTTAALVTDGTFTGTKANAAASLGTRTIHPNQLGTLLDHLQPALPRSRTPRNDPAPTRPTPTTGDRDGEGDSDAPPTPSAPTPRRTQALPGEDPSAIRTWARQNGFTVGERGRLPSEVLEAYRSHHS